MASGILGLGLGLGLGIGLGLWTSMYSVGYMHSGIHAVRSVILTRDIPG